MTDTLSPTPAAPILAIDDLVIEYPGPEGQPFRPVDTVSLTIGPGEIHALVGESGAGKTTIANAVIDLIDPPGRIAAGSVRVNGEALLGSKSIVLGRDIGAIFQDPMTSLNPLFTIGEQLGETMRFHLGLRGEALRQRAIGLLRDVGVPEPERRLNYYPHQLSGGQRQRVVIAAALSCNPKLLIADEPTTALDVSVQAQILKLIRTLTSERRLGVLLVTHNMGVVAEIADHVTVMYRGKAVEQGRVADVLQRPQAPYTRQLLAAVPRVDIKSERFNLLNDDGEKAAAARTRLTKGRELQAVGDTSSGPLLSVKNLAVTYGGGGLFGGKREFQAVKDVSFDISRGEIVGLVGESGCGKTTTANVIAGLVRPSGGTVHLGGKLIAAADQRRPRGIGRLMQMIFQDPYSSLTPRIRVNDILGESILFYKLASTRAEAAQDARLLLEAVGLDASAGERYSFAFSGGQRQRISIARALAARPSILICDEPTSALDVSVQAQILNLIKDLRDDTGLAVLFVSHDLAVVRQMCDKVAVMRAGALVEMAEADELFRQPRSDYTRELLRLIPRVERIGG